jgi:tetratricopeptide (TPR) repeat protein
MNMPQDKAIELLEARMKDNPKSLVFARLADLYLEQGRIDEAIALCNDSSKFHPYYVTGYFILAKAHIALKDLEKAEMALKKVLSHDQQYPAAHKLLGDILCKTNRDSLAGPHYEDVLSIDPLEERVRKSLERIPREAVAPQAEPEPAPVQKSKRESVPPSPPQPEPQEESWINQIKEFRPEDGLKPDQETEKREEAGTLESGIADPFANLVLFDEKDDISGAQIRPDDSSLPRREPAADAPEPPETEPLIGETPYETPSVESEENLSPYLGAGMLPDKGPETRDPGTGLGFENPEAEPFNVPQTGFPVNEEIPKEEERSLHSVFNEPGILDDMPVYSEPTLLDDRPAETEAQTARPAAESESDLSGLFDDAAKSLPPAPAAAPSMAPPSEPSPDGPPPQETPAAGKKLPKIVTPTLGEIYAVQGQFEKAILVYQALLEKTPGEKKYLDKIEEMKKKLRESAGK